MSNWKSNMVMVLKNESPLNKNWQSRRRNCKKFEEKVWIIQTIQRTRNQSAYEGIQARNLMRYFEIWIDKGEWTNTLKVNCNLMNLTLWRRKRQAKAKSCNRNWRTKKSRIFSRDYQKIQSFNCWIEAIMKNIEKIKAVESTATFKSFLQRIWFKSFDEYMKLFWNNIFKRKQATDWCLETYPFLQINSQEKWNNQKC